MFDFIAGIKNKTFSPLKIFTLEETSVGSGLALQDETL